MTRLTVPHGGTTICASCRRPHGNTRKGWTPIFNGTGVAGFTCPDCPRPAEPIRRTQSASGVRFSVIMDATPPGATQRKQARRRNLPTLDAARDFVAEVQAKINSTGTYSADEGETVATLSERWLTSRRDVRVVTLQGYRNHLQPALRLIGSRDVQEIGVRELEIMISSLVREGGKNGRPLGPRSVRAALIALGQVFDLAAREGAISRNVVRQVKAPRQPRRLGRDLEHWPLTDDGVPAELFAFRDTADRDALAGAWRLTLSGLTRADVMGLRWSDVDLEKGTVTVRTGRVALDRGDHVDEPKSAQRRRKVPVEVIHPGTVALLRSLKAAQAADRLKPVRRTETAAWSSWTSLDSRSDLRCTPTGLDGSA